MSLCFLQTSIDEAIEMYQELHMWDDCIAVAEAKVITNRTHYICILPEGDFVPAVCCCKL